MKYKRSFRHSGAKLFRQRSTIERDFPFIECQISKVTNRLNCYGTFQPHPACNRYEVAIIQKAGEPPKVFIRKPEIRYSSAIHVFPDKSLCLFDPREKTWTRDTLISETIIPWINEWIVFYELYLITGKWLGPEAKHDAPERPMENSRRDPRG